MSYLIEVLYLSLALLLSLVLLINLTRQIIKIRHAENELSQLLIRVNEEIVEESIIYTVSQLYIKKYQWIEALQFLMERQQCFQNNKHNLVDFYNILGYIYNKSSRDIASKHYSQLAIFNEKN